MEETLERGTSVARVTQKHEVNANQVFQWWRLYRDGHLGAQGPSGMTLLPVGATGVPDGLQPERMERAVPSPGTIHIALTSYNPNLTVPRLLCLTSGVHSNHVPVFLQRAWLKDHPDSATVVLGEARIAVSEGRFADARRLALHSSEIFHEQGVAGAGDRFLKSVAVEMIESGDIEEGKKLFQSVSPDTEEGQDLLGMVYAGDTAKAMSALHTMQAKYPNGTLWNLYYGPQIHATISMMEHKPGEAATILEAASPIELRELYVPWMRGKAYLEAGDAARAEAEFRKVITHLAADPASCAISLSWLGLARSLAAEKNRAGAIEAYQHFLSLWAHADADALYLHQAKQELAAIQTLPASK